MSYQILHLLKTYVIPIIEILVLWYIFYEVILLLKRTKSNILIKGIVFFIGLGILAKAVNFEVLGWIFDNIVTYSILILVIIFREEIRDILVKIGSIRLLKSQEAKFYLRSLKELVEVVDFMSKNKIGGIIVFERKIPLDDFINTGVKINSPIERDKLLSIFDKNSILHDGAVIVRGLKIIAASCILPIGPAPPVQQPKIGKSFGTRHRAAYGIARETDAIAVVVSEETGRISVVMDYYFSYNVDLEVVENVVEEYFRQYGKILQ